MEHENGEKMEQGKGDKMEARARRPMPTAQEMADKETERAIRMFKLTDSQIAKAKVINLKYCQQRSDLFNNPDKTSLGVKMKAIRESQDNEIKNILDEKQKALLTDRKSRMDARANKVNDENEKDKPDADKEQKESKDAERKPKKGN